MVDHTTSSDRFLSAIEQMAKVFKRFQKQSADEPSIQAVEAVRKRQEEHEERKRRILQATANGARISRNL